jgi:hypothetical protein
VLDGAFFRAVGVPVGIFHIAPDCLVSAARFVIALRVFEAGKFVAAEKLKQRGETRIGDQA